jgi:putative phosphoserine phosphatase/1-acylglycerol-3-phosphate O-acyltransferase
MRLPGSVAEVAASKEGPRVGAFFDLDGTLIAGYSASHLAQQRFRDREVSLSELVRTLGVAVGAGLGRGAGFADLLKLGAEAWRGRANEDLEEMGERLFQQKIEPLIYPEMRELVSVHHRRGHTVVLSSSATSYQVEPVGRFLGIEHVLCNRYELKDGVLTGEVVTPVLWGPGKADAVQKFGVEHGIELADSYFYADGNEDLALMHLVGNPRPTNPGSQLEKIAGARGWPVLRFRSRRSDAGGDRLRATAGLAASVPIGVVGLTVAALTRNRRHALNFTTQRWLDALFQINGVKLDVAGREHVVAGRPAVFVFNHRNNFDVLVATRVVDRDVTAVVPTAAKGNQLIGTFTRLADVVSDEPSIEQSLNKGLSIVVAPEAARLDTTDVGAFDEGAFRAAMAAGVPIVPIVIHDSEMIASRNASSMNAGTVHVTVLPPVPTHDWTPRRFSGRVAAVREQFLDALRAGPTGS